MSCINIANQRFGKLLVIRRASPHVKHGQSVEWFCVCDCGKLVRAKGSSLRRGVKKSCGCLRGANMRRHGLHGLAEYRRFIDARNRCTNPKNKAYKNYGGRGIKFLFESFEQFFAEIGPRPGLEYSLDRKENDGNYEPGNVRWATQSEQVNNRRPYRALQNFSSDALRAELSRRGIL
jgi:hypothetical protein